jgi:hypothetical protein
VDLNRTKFEPRIYIFDLKREEEEEENQKEKSTTNIG